MPLLLLDVVLAPPAPLPAPPLPLDETDEVAAVAVVSSSLHDAATKPNTNTPALMQTNPRHKLCILRC
jgi:hypothetical protein